MIKRFIWMLLCIMLVGGVMFYKAVTDRSAPLQTVTVVIPPGSTLAQAAFRLQQAGVGNALLLRILARWTRNENDVKSGALLFPAHETATEVLARLTVASIPAAVWITIPEGFTAVQIEQALAARHLRAARGFAAYAHHQTIFIGGKRTRSLEGYLFPDTYLIGQEDTAASAAAAMVTQFRHAIPQNAAEQARRLGYSLPQVITIASLVEREAKADIERPHMAGIYYRRLAIGMPLEVDATLEYAFPRHKTVITEADLQRDTPYNSYVHAGLPPTPIANPGLPSIRAALHPLHTHDLYYVYKGGGRHAFAETFEEHRQNIQRYLR